MKNITFFLTICILCLTSSCSEKTDFTLKGEIKNLPNDTLLVYYQMPRFQLDTLICQNGKFTYNLLPDTLTMFSLIINEKETIPVFAEKGETVEINGTTDDLTIKGNGENKLMAQIMKLLKELPSDDLMQQVDSLIQANPHSFTNIYLIDKYYVHNSSADFNRLETLTKNLYGDVKDTPYMTILQNKIESIKKPQKNQSVLSLQAYHKDGKKLKWGDLKDKHIILNFWASWSSPSIAARDSLKTILKEFQKEDLIVYNISLDMDKHAWLEATDEESEQWKHICDFKGWNNNVVKNQNIHQLPYNILLSSKKRIVSRNLSEEELIEKLKQLIKDEKKKRK